MPGIAPEGFAVNGRKLAFGAIDCSPLQVLNQCSRGRIPDLASCDAGLYN